MRLNLDRRRAALLGASLVVATVAGLGAQAVLAASSPTPDEVPAEGGRTLGFAVSWWDEATSHDCPELIRGPTMRSARPPFPGPVTGPKGEDLCDHPTLVPDPKIPTMDKAVNVGLNLDGDDGSGKPPPGACAHQNYVSPAGETGIDNQWGRIFGCWSSYTNNELYNSLMRGGAWSLLIEVVGVDDLRTDPEVIVRVQSGADELILDTGGMPVAGASMQVSNDPKYRWESPGRIVDGVVITTRNADMRVPSSHLDKNPFIRDARMRIELAPDGSAKGLVGGYQDVSEQWRKYVGYARNGTSHNKAGCPAVHYVLTKNADGHRDPKTGRCTTISSAYEFKAVAAHITHPKGMQRALSGAERVQ